MAMAIQSCARVCEVKMEIKNMKKYYFLGIMLAFCGPLVAVQETFKAKVFEERAVTIDLYDTKKHYVVGRAEYWIDTQHVGTFWIDHLYRETGMGKFLAVCVIADIITRHPEIKVVKFKAQSSGDMSDEELVDYYKKLGSVHIGSKLLMLDLDVMRKENTLFDFKKISDFLRSGAAFSFELFATGPVGVPIFCFDGAGNPILRSRL